MKTYKKGISLIVLVITVIVLAILATTVIISLSNTNIITEANEAVVKSRFKSMQEQLTLYVADQYAVTNGSFKLADLDADAKSATIDEIFPELKNTKYYDYVSLVNGNIVLAKNMPDRETVLTVISEYIEPEVITNYTQADVTASNGNIVAIGATNELDVVGVYSADGKTLTISKNSPTSDGKIKDAAFSDEFGATTMKTSVKRINIEKGIKLIGYFAFSGTNAETVNMKDGVLAIDDGAFAGSSIKNITLSDSITNIGNTAFAGTALSSITLPTNLTIIGDDAFSSCSGLTSIILPKSLTQIGLMAFMSTGLETIVIPASLTHIGMSAFYDCPLTSASFENPNGWYVIIQDEEDTTDISSTDLSNSSTAATYLTDTYCVATEWHKE